MRLFFDCEFTGLHKNTNLISIGIIDENNKEIYCEFTDYDKNQINEWLQLNVIDNLVNDPEKAIIGTKSYIRENILKILKERKYDNIQWVSDVCHYDFVLLIDLLYGNALHMPINVSAACYDINQLMAEKMNISLKDSFNLNRESLITIPSQVRKHNALYDAKIIKLLYDKFINY
jgi:hypothetical protein